MSKYVKDLLTAELRERYGGLDSVLWIDLTGADGIVTNQFRADLHARRVRAEVVKNSMFKRACGDGPLAPLARALDGPTMLISGGDSLIDVAKLIDEWAGRIPSLKVRGAVLEGEYLDQTRVGDLSRMPSRAELQARLAGAIAAPGRRLAAAIVSGGARIAGCLKALIEKLESAAPPAAPPAEPPATPAEPEAASPGGPTT